MISADNVTVTCYRSQPANIVVLLAKVSFPWTHDVHEISTAVDPNIDPVSAIPGFVSKIMLHIKTQCRENS